MKNTLLFLSSLIIILGCSTGQYSYREESVNMQYQSLLGKTKEEIVLSVGVPSEQKEIGSLYILTYCKGCSIDTESKSSSLIVPGRILGSGYHSGTSKTKLNYEQLINCYFQKGKMIKYEIYNQDGTIYKVEARNGIAYGHVEYYESILESWIDEPERKRNAPAGSNEIIKHASNAVIADIPIAVRNEVLKEISMDDLTVS